MTGGGRGIGRAIALAFAQEGADVVIAARTISQLENTISAVKALDRKGVTISVDLSHKDAIQPFVDEVFSHFPTVDILVNNVGIPSSHSYKPIIEYEDNFWDLSLFINLTLPYLLMKAFLSKMINQRWGRIINISSAAGKRGFEYASAYCASKHGLIGLTRAVALEVATDGVTVNAICPWIVRTDMPGKRIQLDADRKGISMKEIEKTLSPMQRILEPEEVAGMAVYLASEEAGGLTGLSLSISCGYIMD